MLIQDVMKLARDYGEIIAAYVGTQLSHDAAPQRISRALDADLAGTFTDQKYCQIAAHPIQHLYRLIDTGKPEPTKFQMPEGLRAAQLLLRSRDPRGAWCSPYRPTYIAEYRSFAAIKPEWNLADAVMEMSLRAGAMVYIGRAGRQYDESLRRLLAGGAVQVWVPSSQSHYLSFLRWWLPR